MDRKEKNGYLIEGMVVRFREKPNGKLLDKIIGAKLKSVRLNKGLKAETVVEDNKKFFTSIFDLWKFERGTKTCTSKYFALCKYYDYGIDHLFERIN
jgi:hypothetical protein|tara:strand:- start:106 stop:396 length:291 start_codon:yes stop_codon:yes gene_type:complete